MLSFFDLGFHSHFFFGHRYQNLIFHAHPLPCRKCHSLGHILTTGGRWEMDMDFSVPNVPI